MLVFVLAGGDVGDDADGVQGVLIHRVRVVHVELHLGDDVPPLGDEAAQHPGFVHQGQDAEGLLSPRQDVEEQLHGFRVAAHRIVDQAE